MAQIVHREFQAAETWELSFTCNQADQVTPLDLSGVADVIFRIGNADTADLLTLRKTTGKITVDAGANGTGALAITKTQRDAAGIGAGLYDFVLEVEIDANTKSDQVVGTIYSHANVMSRGA